MEKWWTPDKRFAPNNNNENETIKQNMSYQGGATAKRGEYLEFFNITTKCVGPKFIYIPNGETLENFLEE